MNDKSAMETLAAYLSEEREAPERAMEVARRMLGRCAEDLVTASVVIESVDAESPSVKRLHAMALEVEEMIEAFSE